MSNRLGKYGVVLSPKSAITTLLIGTLNAWSFDYKDPSNQLRDRSVQLRNLADDALGQYTAQLQDELKSLRKKLPEPTRENPYPPMEGLEAVKELEAYIREIESLRVSIRSASVPPQEFTTSKAMNQELLMELHRNDEEILTALSTLNEDTLQSVKRSLERRNEAIKSFVTA